MACGFTCYFSVSCSLTGCWYLPRLLLSSSLSLVWFFHLTLSCPTIGQSVSLLEQSQRIIFTQCKGIFYSNKMYKLVPLHWVLSVWTFTSSRRSLRVDFTALLVLSEFYLKTVLRWAWHWGPVIKYWQSHMWIPCSKNWLLRIQSFPLRKGCPGLQVPCLVPGVNWRERVDLFCSQSLS